MISDRLYEFVGPPSQGGQYIQVEGYQSAGQTTSDRSISRYFNLDPGYYRIDYQYISDINFGAGSFFTTLPPTNASIFIFSGADAGNAYASGTIRMTGGGSGSYGNNTAELGVLMSHSLLASNPIGGGALNSTTSYTNPDGTVTTTPTVPPDAYSVANYNASQVNPLLDFCGYASAWTARTTYFEITKPGQYWLTFASRGRSDNYGAALDDVKLTAVGSLKAITTAPSGTVVIPTPAPAAGPAATAGTTVSYVGFSFTADRPAP